MFNCFPKRYVFVWMAFFATTLAIVIQTNLSLAIVYMIDRSNTSKLHTRASNECYVASTAEVEGNSTYQVRYDAGRYNWSPETQGIILGAIYYGMIPGFVPGGRFAEVYGGKLALTCGMLVASIFTGLLPLAVELSVYALIACRIIIGFASAAIYPALFEMLPHWIPLTERSFCASIIYAGYGSGEFLARIMTGLLCASDFLGGWPSIFYICGLVGLFWCILSFFLLFDSPERHPTIHASEREYIECNVESSKIKQIESIPWRSIFSSVPIWALACANLGQFWIMSFYATSLPLYMGTILNLDSVENGYLTSLPNLIRVLVACICGRILDYIVKKKNIPNVVVRKGATFLNSAMACLGFFAILFAGCDPFLTTVCFVVGNLTGDFLIFGVNLAAIDMAPNLVGTISGIMCALTTLPYFLLPSLIGTFTKYEQSMKQWSYIYYCSIGVISVSTLIYMVLGTSDPQPWGKTGEEISCENEKSNVKNNEKYCVPTFRTFSSDSITN